MLDLNSGKRFQSRSARHNRAPCQATFWWHEMVTW
jgi:hypothetical protein